MKQTKKGTKLKKQSSPQLRKLRALPAQDPESAPPLAGELRLDSFGDAWWHPDGATPSLVSESQSLCGVGIFSTGKDDPFIECCICHDHMYASRKFIEEHGWNRSVVDDFFFECLLQIAGEDVVLKAKAIAYNKIVRSIGWIFYYRH